ncbi:MAG: hypothetical protein KDB03_11950 [Planctomycetales bacterium]|nr:hypothetical protein [Planctomycetales bacterium]
MLSKQRHFIKAYSSRRRRGSTVMVALIVLVVVTLSTHQAYRLLHLMRESSHRAAKIKQAKELIELGKLMIALRSHEKSSAEEVPVRTVIAVGEDHGLIEIEFVGSKEELSNSARSVFYRIHAKIPVTVQGTPLDNSIPVSASWEGELFSERTDHG